MTKKEYINILRKRYAKTNSKKEKSAIINECKENLPNMHRKSIIRALNKKVFKYRKKGSGAKEKYTYDLIKPLKQIWKASGYACSKNLQPNIPYLIDNMKKYEKISLIPGQEDKLRSMSTYTIDRLLKYTKLKMRGEYGISGTTTSKHLKQLIPVRTDWDLDTTLGKIEIDCVLHCGTSLAGIYAETLNMVDIVSGWSERKVFLKKTSVKVVGALHDAITHKFPFPIKSIDFDNGFEFVNKNLMGYCKRENIKVTRSRSYHKNDQAHIEERNRHLVRNVIGYDRIEEDNIVNFIADIYDNELHYLSNYFWTIRKLKYKAYHNGKYIKKYDQALTPYQRIMADKHVSIELKDKLTVEYNTLDVVELSSSLESKLRRLKKMISVTHNYLATTST